MSESIGHPEQQPVEDGLAEALDRALSVGEPGLSAEGSARLLALTDVEMTARLDAALSAPAVSSELTDRLVALMDEPRDAVVGRIAPAAGVSRNSWWRVAAAIGVVGGLVGLLVLGGGDGGSEEAGVQVAVSPAVTSDDDAVDPDAVSDEALAVSLSEEFEALNGWLASDASASEAGLDRRLSVFAARLASVDTLASSSVPMSADEVAEAAAGEAELRDDLDLIELYAEEWTF